MYKFIFIHINIPSQPHLATKKIKNAKNEINPHKKAKFFAQIWLRNKTCHFKAECHHLTHNFRILM